MDIGKKRYGLTLLYRLFILGSMLAIIAAGSPAQDVGQYTGEIRIFAGNYAPSGWYLCNGQSLDISSNGELYTLLGTTFGGNGTTTFNVPDLQGRVPVGQGSNGTTTYTLGEEGGVETVTLTVNQIPIHSHSLAASSLPGVLIDPANAVLARYPDGVGVYSTSPDAQGAAGVVSSAGSSQPHDNMQPYLAINYIIANSGTFPNFGGDTTNASVVGAYPGEIRLVAFSQTPNGWLDCSGINGHPDLRGRILVGADGTTITLGSTGGEDIHTLTTNEMPAHSHSIKYGSGGTASASPVGNYPARNPQGDLMYAPASNTTMNAGALSSSGGSLAHENRKPFTALHYIEAVNSVGSNSSPFLGEIRTINFSSIPSGWAAARGQLISIATQSALFSLVGTYYGGNGSSNFAYPNFNDVMGIGWGQNPGGSNYNMGQTGGESSVILTTSNLPLHSHVFAVSAEAGTSSVPTNNVLAVNPGGATFYNSSSSGGTMYSSSTNIVGGGQAHNNMMTYYGINYMIATSGIYPSRSTTSPVAHPVAGKGK